MLAIRSGDIDTVKAITKYSEVTQELVNYSKVLGNSTIVRFLEGKSRTGTVLFLTGKTRRAETFPTKRQAIK